MNKTIIININGTVFHIEEQAYELLKNYMTDVKRHFFGSADSLEITTDIENRIAEMFTEILARDSRQAIIDQDVTAVIAQMGSVSDFEPAEENAKADYAQNSAYEGTASRRLFRNPDEHLVGGVCAGIANYFDIQPVWVRLFFAFAVAAGGAGFMVYIILWIIIPKATSRADRMAMKGEPLDLQGFKRNFEAEMSIVGGRLAGMTNDVRPLAYRTRDFIGDFFHHLGVFFRGTGKIIIKLLGVGIILACMAGIIAVIVALVATWAFGSHAFSLPSNFFNYEYINQVRVGAALLAIIPLTCLIVLMASVVFSTALPNRSVWFTLLIVWTSALIVVVYHGSRVAGEFSEPAGFKQTLNLKPAAGQVYYIQLNESRYLTAEDSSRLDIKNNFRDRVLTDNDDDNGFDSQISVHIEKGDVPYPVLVEEFTARGRTYEAALKHARNIHYGFSQQDSVLKFDTRFIRLASRQWHNEEVRLTLYIPLDAKVMINGKVDDYISNRIDLRECLGDNEKYERNRYIPYVMTLEGLQCGLLSVDDVVEGNRADTDADNDVILQDSTTVDTISKTDTTVVVTTRKVLTPRHRHRK